MALFRRSRPPPRAPEAPLFDEAFQRKLETLVLISRHLATGKERAERKAVRTGTGVEFADHRAYVAGDDFRFVDWKVFARTERLLVKQFEQEADLCVYLLLDVSASMAHGDGEKLRYAKRLAAALGYVALANLDRVGVQAFGDALGGRLPPTRGRARAVRMLRFLEQLESHGGTDLARCAKAFTARETRPGLTLVLTDGYDFAGLTRGIDALRYARYEPVLLLVTEPSEADPPLHGELLLVDAETLAERHVTITEALLERYRAARRAHFASLMTYCREKRVRAFELPTDRPFDEAALQLMRRGGLLE
jgi:uncharacterized protein (DUF58 family)